MCYKLLLLIFPMFLGLLLPSSAIAAGCSVISNIDTCSPDPGYAAATIIVAPALDLSGNQIVSVICSPADCRTNSLQANPATFCLFIDYNGPDDPGYTYDITLYRSGNGEGVIPAGDLTPGPHELFIYPINTFDSSGSLGYSKCSQARQFTIAGATPTPTPTPAVACMTAGTCCEIGVIPPNGFCPNVYCGSTTDQNCLMNGGGMAIVGAPTPLPPTPTNPQGFWKNLTGSVIGVQCPANQTYIAIFDSCLDFASTMSWTMTWALIIASLLALVRFAIGSIQLVFSTGDPSKLQNGRESLTDAILGLVLLSIAWIVFGYLNSTLPPEWQINLLTLFG